MRKVPQNEALEEWSRRIQVARLLQRLTQGDLAQRAGVTISTIYRAEHGLPIHESSMRKICAGLDMKYDHFLNMKATSYKERESHGIHRAAQGRWFAPVDHRKKIPEDNEILVQSPAERQRLGRNGLTPVFACFPNFVMAEGPGAVVIEIYGRYSQPINPKVYRECIVYCQRGAVRLQVLNDVVELGEGDMVGFTSRDLRWIEPGEPLSDEGPPPLALWFGAVRLGKLEVPEGKRAIVRRPRAPF